MQKTNKMKTNKMKSNLLKNKAGFAKIKIIWSRIYGRQTPLRLHFLTSQESFNALDRRLYKLLESNEPTS